MRVFPIRPANGRTATVAALAALALAGGCAPLRSHQGYIVDAQLVDSVQPGVDNRQSVLATLGTPTFKSEFTGGDWYYLSRDSRNYSYSNPKPRDQLTMEISFNDAGTVTAIRRTGLDQVVSVNPDRKTTPTLGRKRGFFHDLFGNIGTVGAAGGSGAGNGDNTGGGGP